MKRNYRINKAIIGLLLLLTIFNGLFTTISADETGSILYVGGSGDGNYSHIQIAVKEAQDGDTIIVYPGVYQETLVIDSSIHINGRSAVETRIIGDKTTNVIQVNADDVKLSNLTIEHSGIFVNSNDNSVEDDDPDDGLTPVQPILDLRTLPVNFSGIYSEFDNTIISSCILADCETGVFLRNGSQNQIIDCVFTNNTQCGYLVQLDQAIITNCHATGNNIGFYYYYTEHSEMKSCNISNNFDAGVLISESHQNLFTMNHWMNNSFAVILIDHCRGNVFYSNAIIGNRQMQVLDNCNNSWDNGHIGNYWDDYMGNDTNADGIGDTDYDIVQVSKDHFPLMQKPTGSDNQIIIHITSPLTYENSTDQINLSGEVESSDAIEQVLIRFDQRSWIAAQGTTSWSISIDTKGLPVGSYPVFISVKTSELQSEVLQETITFSGDDSDQPGNGPDSSDTPGFLMFSIFFALFIVFILKKRD